MKAVGIFLLSCTVHWTSFIVLSLVGLWVGLAVQSTKPFLLLPLLHLIVVAALGYMKAVRWPSRWGVPFSADLAVAAVGATLVLIAADYGLSFPSERSSPPPFWAFIVDYELSRKNALLWIAAPVVAWLVISEIGSTFGRRSAHNRRRAAQQ